MSRKVRSRNRGAGKGVKIQLDERTLRRLYVDETLTQREISKRYGCSAQFISLLLKEYSIRRPHR